MLCWARSFLCASLSPLASEMGLMAVPAFKAGSPCNSGRSLSLTLRFPSSPIGRRPRLPRAQFHLLPAELSKLVF